MPEIRSLPELEDGPWRPAMSAAIDSANDGGGVEELADGPAMDAADAWGAFTTVETPGFDGTNGWETFARPAGRAAIA